MSAPAVCRKTYRLKIRMAVPPAPLPAPRPQRVRPIPRLAIQGLVGFHSLVAERWLRPRLPNPIIAASIGRDDPRTGLASLLTLARQMAKPTLSRKCHSAS